VERRYHITEKENTEAVRGFLSKNGQALLHLVEQIEQAEVARGCRIHAAVRHVCDS
jgi:hypothetical protein